MLTDKEKRMLKNQKKLKSFRNRMGSNIVWFDSLTTTRQYDLLFEWEYERYKKRDITKPKKEKRKKLIRDKGRWVAKFVEVTVYPANLKHFIKSVKDTQRYKPEVANIRGAAIDLLLKNK